VAHYQDAINERAVTIDRGGCAAARSEHSVIATFGMTFLFLRWKDAIGARRTSLAECAFSFLDNLWRIGGLE
jgi:hypothetical protein